MNFSNEQKITVGFYCKGSRDGFIKRWNVDYPRNKLYPTARYKGKQGFFAYMKKPCTNMEYAELCQDSATYQKGFMDAMLAVSKSLEIYD